MAPWHNTAACISWEATLAPDPHAIVPLDYPWADEGLRSADYGFLERKYDDISARFASGLNEVHGLSLSTREWEVALGAWLGISLSVILDRYRLIEAVRNAAHGSICVPGDPSKFRSPLTTKELADCALRDDEWNANFIALLLSKLGVNARETEDPRKKEKTRSESAARGFRGSVTVTSRFGSAIRQIRVGGKDSIIRAVSSLAQFRRRKSGQSLIYYEPGIPTRALASLIWHFPGVRPPSPRFGFQRGSEEKPELKRSRLREKFDTKSDEHDTTWLLLSTMVELLPRTLLEEFSPAPGGKVADRAAPDWLFTSVSHYYNDVFRIRAALWAHSGTKLLLSAHGGSLRHSQVHFDFEQRIATLYVCGRPSKKAN